MRVPWKSRGGAGVGTPSTRLMCLVQGEVEGAQVRLELVHPAGAAVGYTSASQFSREYRRLFGAPPGRDAAQPQNASRTPY